MHDQRADHHGDQPAAEQPSSEAGQHARAGPAAARPGPPPGDQPAAEDAPITDPVFCAAIALAQLAEATAEAASILLILDPRDILGASIDAQRIRSTCTVAREELLEALLRTSAPKIDALAAAEKALAQTIPDYADNPRLIPTTFDENEHIYFRTIARRRSARERPRNSPAA
jgi:hypothetical protein